MADPNWDAGIIFVVPAKAKSGLWTMALEYVDVSKKLKFIVDDIVTAPSGQANQAPISNKWNYALQKPCTADGDPQAAINMANCLLPDVAAGALVAKIGGSSAGKNDGSKSFAVGSFCTIALDDKTSGTLYLTMNADPLSSSQREGELRVRIYRSN